MTPASGTWSSLLALPLCARWLLLGMGLTRVASFMIWPFIAVTMHQRFGTPITDIGAQLALGAVLAIALAPLSGWLGDRFNSRNLMLLGCVLCAACYTLMGLLPGQSSYFLAIIGLAVAQSILEPLLRVLLSDLAVDDAQRTFLFHIRYYVVNCAAAIGPLLGLGLAGGQGDAVFAVAVVAYAVLILTLLEACRARLRQCPRTSAASLPLGQVLRAVLGNRLFLVILLANFFLVLVYAQLDEPLTFYLLQLQLPQIKQVIASISFTNACVVVGVHLFMMRWLIALAERSAYLLALGCLMVAHALIALNVHAWWGGWLIAVVFATLAEIIVMPLFASLIDRLAPAGMRGSFIGISMLAGLGAAIAPWLGALVISHYGGVALFATLALACVPIGLLGYHALRAGRACTLAGHPQALEPTR
ncbi:MULTISPECIES: MFS transporter [unclassified Pseudomonas]|uniref:MFS transporter n=1 Tax=unclassified Pseudomonas TaxID=196821 RepID=UPI0035C23B17